MNINEKTSLPISWFIASFIPLLSIAFTGAFWIKSVNDRLSRIEDKLGIQMFSNAKVTDEFVKR